MITNNPCFILNKFEYVHGAVVLYREMGWGWDRVYGVGTGALYKNHPPW